MSTVVFRSAENQVYGANAHQVFFAPQFNGDESLITSGEKLSLEQLGKEGVIIENENIKQIRIVHTNKNPIGVIAKGLGDDILVNASSVEDQNGFATFLSSQDSISFSKNTQESSLFQTAPKTFLALIIAIIMTAGGFMAARQHESGKNISTDRVGLRGNQQRGFAEVVKILGPIGTLAVGGVITIGLGGLLARQRKNHHTIDIYNIK